MTFQIGDVVLIADLSASDGQNPFSRLGLITEWMDNLHAQAVICYGGAGNKARTCNRPLSKMIQLVPVKETVPEAGLLWDTLVLGDVRAAAPPTDDDDDNDEEYGET